LAGVATRRWPHPAEKPVWQRDFFDRQLRNGESYHQKWLYLWENPIKDGLVNGRKTGRTGRTQYIAVA